MTRHAWLAALGAALVLSVAAPLRAQTSITHPVTPAPPGAGFFTGYTFHMNAASMTGGGDPAFQWDADFGGDVDLVDYGKGRLNFLANYQVVMGDQFQLFDPNQGNYALEFSSSLWVGKTEIAGVFHHMSRHLGDRPKVFAVAWNEAGVRASRLITRGPWRASAQGTIAWITNRAYVDYNWEGEGAGDVRYRLNRYWSAIGGASLTLIGVDQAKYGRGLQTGAHAEAGLRIDGTHGALELFAAYDRRIDAGLFDLQTRTFGLLGFRLLSR
ncbi:MAG: hypothetical protein KGN76_12560 [Acidobacteriota bacterium]|nr:hypothetical protein [Acidobacteriota bacterium]